MSLKVRYRAFAGVLAAGVAAAVSTIGAQEPRDRREPTERREVRVLDLDGRGSRLGVMVRDLDSAQTAAAGVAIESVDPGSPAEKAGLRAGDVVVEFDGERVRSARQFTRLVQETPAGRAVPMAILRDGRRQSVTATPDARAFSWDLDIDGGRIRREVERGLEGLRDFQFDGPMRFRFDRDPGALVMPTGRGRLGVTVDTLSEQLAEYFGAANGGALVTGVRPESPAATAGLKAGDVITAINGERVRDAGDVARAVSRADGGEVSIDYLRDRKAATASATLAGPHDDQLRPRAQARGRGRPA